MAKTSPDVRPVSTGTITTALSTTYIAPTAISILSNDLVPAPSSIPSSGKWGIKISAIYIHVHAISGASSLTLRLHPDSTGDEFIIPDTTATLATGYTTATKGGVVFKADVDVFLESQYIYYSIKTDAGTATLKDVTITIEMS